MNFSIWLHLSCKSLTDRHIVRCLTLQLMRKHHKKELMEMKVKNFLVIIQTGIRIQLYHVDKVCCSVVSVVRRWGHAVPCAHNPNLWLSLTFLFWPNMQLREPDVSWEPRLELCTQCKRGISAVERTRKVMCWWKLHGMKGCCFHLNCGSRLQGVCEEYRHWHETSRGYKGRALLIPCSLFQPSVSLKQSHSSCAPQQTGPQCQGPFTQSRTLSCLFPPSFYFPFLLCLW